MELRIAVLPGDGIGPEVTAQAVRVLEAAAESAGARLRLETRAIGAAALRDGSPPLPPATLAACLSSDAVFLGAVGDPAYDHAPPDFRPEQGLLALRQALGGYANLRPATCMPALVDRSPLRADRVRGADVLVVRELLGGLYFGEPRSLDLKVGRAVNTLAYERDEIVRVARVAFGLARGRRRLVTSVDKANVLETSRLWREVVSAVGRQFPDVRLTHVYVDACAMKLVAEPSAFDVILTENLFGDILSDQAAAIAGSLGMLPSATVGGRVPLFEPVHGSAPDLAGRDAANPIGAIASAAMLLDHVGLGREAAAVHEAIAAAVGAGWRTADLAGPDARPCGTRAMGDAIVAALAERLACARAPLALQAEDVR